MIAAAQHRPRLPALTRVLLSLTIAVALWLFRPGPPSLPASFPAPLTIDTIHGLTVWLIWLVAALLALALLFTPRRARAHLSVATASRSRHAPSSPPGLAARPQPQPPSLVIPSPETAPDARANARPAASGGPLPVDRTALTSIAVPSRPQISLLGPLTITGAKRSRRGLRARALELIAYLAMHPRQVQRDELLEAFWPGADPRRTWPRFRQAVRDARRLLGDAIAGEHERYWLDRAQVDVDVDEVELLLAAANTAERGDAQALMESALRLFRGEPLAGSDYAWSETELPRLRATFIDLLEQVGRRRVEAGEARTALELAERGLDVDALNESLWRLAMEAEGALGLREGVAERYERLRALLDERLGLEPSQETRRLHLRLLAQT